MLETNLTKLTIIGDPLQAIFRFTYLHSLIREESKTQPKSFSDTPMMSNILMFHDDIDEILISNHRSSTDIVKLTNNYIAKDEHKQLSINGYNSIAVYIIDEHDASKIYKNYKKLKVKHGVEHLHKENLKNAKKPFLKELILTSDWIDKKNKRKPKYSDIFNNLYDEFAKIEQGNHRNSGLLYEASRCILAVAGIRKKDFIQTPLDEVNFRKFCFDIVRSMKIVSFNNYDHRINFIRKRLQQEFNVSVSGTGRQVDVEKSLTDISSKGPIKISHYPESCYSSIHSAKGLEATSVLAIAYSNNELSKWFEFDAANTKLDDDYRLGYVAFSRARDMLCIACLEPISIENKNKLERLNIVFQ